MQIRAINSHGSVKQPKGRINDQILGVNGLKQILASLGKTEFWMIFKNLFQLSDLCKMRMHMHLFQTIASLGRSSSLSAEMSFLQATEHLYENKIA